MKRSSQGTSFAFALLFVFLAIGQACASELRVLSSHSDFLRGGKIKDEWFLQQLPHSYNGTLPLSFDLSAQGKTPPVRSQRSWGTCWAFAGVEAMESSLLVETGKLHNLSELHLAYFTYSFEGQDKPGFTRGGYNDGDGDEDEMNNVIFDNGGHISQIVSMLSRGTGPVSEEDAPYPEWLDSASDHTWKNYIPPAPYAPTRFRLKNAFYYSDAEDVKKALMTLGGLWFSYIHDIRQMGKDLYSSEMPTEEDFGEKLVGGHAVLLVGWDDHYPKEKFRSPSGKVPTNDGAWKIQNSWGEAAGDKGYYWISYEDVTILNDDEEDWSDSGVGGFKLERVDAYDGIYFHDPLGSSGAITNELPEARMANVFVANRDEKVVSVGFITANLNVNYEIQIYRNIPKGMGPAAGTPVFNSPQRGVAGARGYYSVSLNAPVTLNKGERFAVEVKLIADKGSYPQNIANISVEMMIAKNTDNVSVAPGESYLHLDGEWKDTYYLLLHQDRLDNYSDRNFNLNVKAFTVATSGGGDTASEGSSSGGCNSGVFGVMSLVVVFALLGNRTWLRMRS